MAKKIYDIVPPKVARKVETTIKSLYAKDAKKKKTAKSVKLPKKGLLPQALQPADQLKRRFPLREILVGGAVVFLLFGIYFYNKLSKVTIEILPKLDLITLDSSVTADKSVKEVDLEKKLIPLKLLEEEKESSQEFPATGITSNDGKAAGTIKIYNKLSPSSPIALISGTHFLSDSGKYFVTLAKVAIPAMKGKTPGSVSVKVQAKEVGPEHNIGPSKFSVPKLSGTAYYYSIWGESKEAMSGGYAGKVKKVTKDDLKSAGDVLTEKLLENTRNSLNSKVLEDEVLLNDAIVSKVVSVTADAKPDKIVDKFNVSAKVKASALVFKKRDAESFAKEDILSKITEDKSLLESSLELSYSVDAVDFAKATEKISLQSSANTYYNIDLTELADLLKRKSSDEVKEVINLKYGEKVSKINVKFWPFWVKKSPKDIDKIKISLIFE
ncbi:MAG: hypothetical protein AAB340_02345 [Patescibacteria group bacterium]